MLFSSINTGVQIVGALGSGSSAITIFIATVLLIILGKNEERVLALAIEHVKTPIWKQRLGTWWARVALLVVASLVLVLLASVSSVLTYVRPDAFAGWTPGSPLRFGRHVASISRQVVGQEQYCAQAHITGDLGNTTNAPLKVYAAGPVRVWSTDPSASFDATVAMEGLTGFTTTVIGPGDSVPITITASVAPENCRSFKASTLAALRGGRLNASGGLMIRGAGGDTQNAFRFEALPIAPGGL